MRLWPLDKQKNSSPAPAKVVEELQERLHRLEIESRQLRERIDDLEGRHASLSAQFRGRMGGRPVKNPAPSGVMPLGAQLLLNQEQR